MTTLNDLVSPTDGRAETAAHLNGTLHQVSSDTSRFWSPSAAQWVTEATGRDVQVFETVAALSSVLRYFGLQTPPAEAEGAP